MDYHKSSFFDRISPGYSYRGFIRPKVVLNELFRRKGRCIIIAAQNVINFLILKTGKITCVSPVAENITRNIIGKGGL